MKRLHVHVAVDDLNEAIGFYSTLFAAEPSVSRRLRQVDARRPARQLRDLDARRQGRLDHLGIQVESETNWPRSMGG